jgi:molybdopterin/thiamine biosynthesis adenylyltransferase
VEKKFEYHEAFSRNIGWISETEQEILNNKRIAIAGLGGVGGSHLLTHVRLGIGKFSIADPDIFELANFNRQAGASLTHINRPKVDVLTEMARDINPDLELATFPQGVDPTNLDQFLEGVDLYIDGLDFFALEARRAVFAACTKKGIPAITAAPLGMGVALLAFIPGKMTFEEYFRLAGQPTDEQLLRFLLGLSPAMLQMPYLVDNTRVDLDAHKGPSTPMACELCAGMAATHSLKVLLNRGPVPAAPRGVHFDAYRNRLSHTWRPWGNDNPIQKLGLKIARKQLSKKPTPETPAQRDTLPETRIERILDLARWSPSGDNTQPWRFEILSASRFMIHAHDTRDWCLYDLDGRASQTAVGALLETINIAATGEGLRATFTRQADAPESHPLIAVTLNEMERPGKDPLLPFIKARVTQRRPFSTRPLTPAQKNILEQSVGDAFRVVWLEGRDRRWQMARLMFKNAHIRLTIREAYEVHKRIIQWDSQFSEDRIPDQAVGLDPVALKLMKWAMQRWDRVDMLNRYFAGTLMPRIQLDLIPAWRCAAHFILVARHPLDGIDGYFDGGRATQRFWLTATRLGLQFQPEVTPLIFSRYTAESRTFTTDQKAQHNAARLKRQLESVVGADNLANAVFIGRVGVGIVPKARSLRHAVYKMILNDAGKPREP